MIIINCYNQVMYGYVRRATEFGAAAAALGEEEAQRDGAALPFLILLRPERAAISMVISIVNSIWLCLLYIYMAISMVISCYVYGYV